MADDVSAMDWHLTTPPSSLQNLHSSTPTRDHSLESPPDQLHLSTRQGGEDNQEDGLFPIAKRICRDIRGKMMQTYEMIAWGATSAKNTIQSATRSAVVVPAYSIVRKLRAAQRIPRRSIPLLLPESPWTRAETTHPIELARSLEDLLPTKPLRWLKRRRSESPTPLPKSETIKRVRLSPRIITRASVTPARALFARSQRLSQRRPYPILPYTPRLSSMLDSDTVEKSTLEEATKDITLDHAKPQTLSSSVAVEKMTAQGGPESPTLQTKLAQTPVRATPSTQVLIPEIELLSLTKLGSPWPVLFPTNGCEYLENSMSEISPSDQLNEELAAVPSSTNGLGERAWFSESLPKSSPNSNKPTDENASSQNAMGLSARTTAAINGSPLAHKCLNTTWPVSFASSGEEDSISKTNDFRPKMSILRQTPFRTVLQALTPMPMRKRFSSIHNDETTPHKSVAETDISSACDLTLGAFNTSQLERRLNINHDEISSFCDATPGAFPASDPSNEVSQQDTPNGSSIANPPMAVTTGQETTEISSACDISAWAVSHIRPPADDTNELNGKSTPPACPAPRSYVSPESPYSFEVHDCTIPLDDDSKFQLMVEEANARGTARSIISPLSEKAPNRVVAIIDDSPPSSPAAAEPKTPSPNRASPTQAPATELASLSLGDEYYPDLSTPKAGYHSAEKTQRLTRAEKRKLESQQDAFNYVIKPLSADWNAKIQHALSRGHGSYAASDLVRVVPLNSGRATSNWLNDEVINGYLNLIVAHGRKNDRPTQKVPSYHAFNSFFYNNLATRGYDSVKRWAVRAKISGRNLLEVEKIFVPINSGLHWTLAVISGRAKVVTHYNSLGGGGKAYLDTIKQWLIGELGPAFDIEEWKFENAGESPKQQNSDDCGVFTITSARQIMLGLTPMSYTAAQIPLQRRRIVAELINGELIRSRPTTA